MIGCFIAIKMSYGMPIEGDCDPVYFCNHRIALVEGMENQRKPVELGSSVPNGRGNWKNKMQMALLGKPITQNNNDDMFQE